MKDLKEKIYIVEKEFDKFRTFVKFWNLRNAYLREGTLDEVDGKLFDKSGVLVSDMIISYEYVNEWLNDFESTDPNKFRVYSNMRKSYLKKRKRVFDRNRHILENYKYVYFVTLTFDDKYLSYKFNTRRGYVLRYCKQFTAFITNIDYGDTDEYIDSKGNKRIGTHREHYHGIIGFNDNSKIDKLDNWFCGFSYIEKVAVSDDDLVRLSKYLVKLTNHNLKLSTKGNNIIYSKSIKNL